MTEEEWRACGDPSFMLRAPSWVGRISDRKLRLFAVAACRRIWFWLEEPQNELILVEQEKFADGWLPDLEIRQDKKGADWPGKGVTVDTPGWSFALSVTHATKQDVGEEEMEMQAFFLRCIFGPTPFRSVHFSPCWVTQTVQQVADSIYESRGFDRLHFLADALEDAGCSSQDILKHLRQPEEHVRGCWALDLVLGKK